MIRRVLAAGGAAAAAMIFAASPASAGQGLTIYTKDPGARGGYASFIADGDILKGCDVDADGLRPSVEMTYSGGSYSFDVFGGEGHCRQAVDNLPEGTKVKVKVCLKDGDQGAEKYCGIDYGVA